MAIIPSMTIVRHLLFIRNLPSSQNLFSKNSKLHIKFMYLNWTRKQTFPNAEGHPLKCVFLWMKNAHTKNPNANHKYGYIHLFLFRVSLGRFYQFIAITKIQAMPSLPSNGLCCFLEELFRGIKTCVGRIFCNGIQNNVYVHVCDCFCCIICERYIFIWRKIPALPLYTDFVAFKSSGKDRGEWLYYELVFFLNVLTKYGDVFFCNGSVLTFSSSTFCKVKMYEIRPRAWQS